jgi:hypothetical protein
VCCVSGVCACAGTVGSLFFVSPQLAAKGVNGLTIFNTIVNITVLGYRQKFKDPYRQSRHIALYFRPIHQQNWIAL